MLALLTTVTTSRKNRKEFKGMLVAAILNYNNHGNSLEYCHCGYLLIQADTIPAVEWRHW